VGNAPSTAVLPPWYRLSNPNNSQRAPTPLNNLKQTRTFQQSVKRLFKNSKYTVYAKQLVRNRGFNVLRPSQTKVECSVAGCVCAIELPAIRHRGQRRAGCVVSNCRLFRSQSWSLSVKPFICLTHKASLPPIVYSALYASSLLNPRVKVQAHTSLSSFWDVPYACAARTSRANPRRQAACVHAPQGPEPVIKRQIERLCRLGKRLFIPPWAEFQKLKKLNGSCVSQSHK